MSTKFRNLKNDLLDLENETSSQNMSGSSAKGSSKIANYILLFAFFATLLVYIGSRFNTSDIILNPIDNVVQSITASDTDLINRMGAWMTEMGYGELTQEELIDLRSKGVTATFTNQIREAGYPEVTLEQLVALQDAEVSATYAVMMKELGYELSIQDLIDTRNAGVTANYTSQMMDLGYTLEQLSKENLIRLRTIGVTTANARKLLSDNGTLATIEELIRYRISNQ